MKHAKQHSLTVTLANCDIEFRDRFWLQIKLLRSFWGPSRLLLNRNFAIGLLSWTQIAQNTGNEHRWERGNNEISTKSHQMSEYSRVWATDCWIFGQKWFLSALVRSGMPNYPSGTKDAIHFMFLREASRFWNDTLGPEIALLSCYRTDIIRNVDFWALERLKWMFFIF